MIIKTVNNIDNSKKECNIESNCEINKQRVDMLIAIGIVIAMISFFVIIGTFINNISAINLADEIKKKLVKNLIIQLIGLIGATSIYITILGIIQRNNESIEQIKKSLINFKRKNEIDQIYWKGAFGLKLLQLLRLKSHKKSNLSKLNTKNYIKTSKLASFFVQIAQTFNL
jgi:hypothetical protein